MKSFGEDVPVRNDESIARKVRPFLSQLDRQLAFGARRANLLAAVIQIRRSFEFSRPNKSGALDEEDTTFTIRGFRRASRRVVTFSQLSDKTRALLNGFLSFDDLL